MTSFFVRYYSIYYGQYRSYDFAYKTSLFNYLLLSFNWNFRIDQHPQSSHMLSQGVPLFGVNYDVTIYYVQNAFANTYRKSIINISLQPLTPSYAVKCIEHFHCLCKFFDPLRHVAFSSIHFK